MSYFGGGGQNGGGGGGGGGGGNRAGGGGNQPQTTTLLTGPQLFVNSNSQLQFQTGGGSNYFPGGEGSQSHVQLNTGGAPLLLQPPVNFVTDGLGVGISQLITAQGSIMSLGNVLQMDPGGGGQGQQSKQRVFTGIVTKIHDNFGFIDEEVFFQMGVVKGPILPKEGDRVLVEADYNPSMPFKWNATRVQIVNMGSGGGGSVSQQQSGGYQGYSSSVQKQIPPPPALSSGGGGRPQQQSSGNMISSNPHSMYGGRPSGHVHISGGGMSDPQMIRRPLSSSQQQLPPHLQEVMSSSSGLMGGLPSLMSKMDSQSGGGRERGGDRERERERDRGDNRDRKDKERERGGRDRSRSKDRSGGGRERRERSRERGSERVRVRRSRSKSRDRRRRSPSPVKRRSRDRTERSGDAASWVRENSVERKKESRERRERDRSPASSRNKADRIERVKRSRSRDTIKSSEGKGSSSNQRDKSRSISPRRGGNKATHVKNLSRYSCDAPKFSLDVVELNSSDMKSRYKSLYVPSDFFFAKACWMEAFPLTKPYQFSLTSSLVHIMGRRVERLEMNLDDDCGDLNAFQERFNQVPCVLQAPDSSCTFSVKVMILSSPSLETIFRKSGFILETDNPDASKDITTVGFQTLQRLLNFVVGIKTGKHDIAALGGNWSPSLDGPDPQSNPRVLINTAIRCCKAMASLDLTRCKYWYRFMEIYYRRSNGNLETVVYFLPDLSSCVPSTSEWDKITRAYRVALYGANADFKPLVDPVDETQTPKTNTEPSSISKVAAIVTTAAVGKLDENWEAGGQDVVMLETTEDITDESGNDVVIVPDNTDDDASRPRPSELSSATGGVGGDTSSERMEVIAEEVNGITEMEPDEPVDQVLIEPTTTVKLTVEVKEVEKEVDIYDDIAEGSKSDVNIKTSTPGTHHSQLDIICMTVAKLREELALRNLNTKGLKAQLSSRLQQALASEKEKEAATTTESLIVDDIKAESMTTDSQVALIDANSTNEKNDESEELAVLRLVDPSTLLETSIDEGKDAGEEIVKNDEELNSQFPDQQSHKHQEIGALDDQVLLDHIKSTKGALSYPVIKPEMKVDERKLWEKRFAVPKNPRVLLFPASKGNSSSSSMKKSGSPFDCSFLPLSSLRDYRTFSNFVQNIPDKREESFEVYLFSEFFYEMLQRDFGFRIYSEIVRQAGLVKNSDKGGGQDDEETETKGEPASKKRKTSSASIVPGVINNVEMRDKVMKTVDPLLLLAFTFFDEHQVGYLTDDHIEDICSALGLGLTRHEVHKLLRKVTSKSCLYYRKWTDKTESEIDGDTEQSLLAEESKFDPEFISNMAKGNKSLLPVFTYSSPIVSFDDGKLITDQEHKYEQGEEAVLATVDGQVVDVRHVKYQLENLEKEKKSAEANVNVFKNSLTEAKNQVSELKKSNESLSEELKKTKDHVKELEASEKLNKEMLDIFKKSTESFVYRIKDIVKLPQKKISSIVIVPDNDKSTSKTRKETQSVGESSSSGSSAAENNADEKKK